MANYSLTINSKFQPFSLERYLRPYEIYGQAYKEQEAALAALDAQASVWDKLKQSAIDQDVYNQYKAYSDDLKNTADILATEGLSPSIRSAGKQLFARYAAEITPIEEAYKRRQAEADRQAASADRYVYEYDARNKGLRSYMDNTSQVARAIDKVALAQQSAKAYSALAKEMRDIKNPRANYKKLDSFHNILTNQYGYSSSEAANFINAVRNGEISTSDAALSAVYNSLYNSTGVSSWDNQAAKNEVSNTILDGVSQAVGTAQRQVVENIGAKIAAEEASRKRVAKYAHDLENQPIESNFPVIPEALRSKEDKKQDLEFNKEFQQHVRNGFIAKDAKGRWIMTPKGRTEYYNNKMDLSGFWAGSVEGRRKANEDIRLNFNKYLRNGIIVRNKWGNHEFTEKGKREFARKYGVRPSSQSSFRRFADTYVGNGGTVQGAYDKHQEGAYDMYHSTQFNVPIQESNYNNIYMATRNGVDAVEYKNGKYVKTETLSPTDLAGYTPISYGLHNDKDKKGDNVIVWKDEDNNIITTRMPSSLNAAATATTTNLVQNATEWNMVAKGNKRPKLAVINGVPVIQRDAKGNIVYDGVMTDADRAAFQEAADRAAQDLYRVAGSNLNVRYESKPVSLVPFGQ